MENKKRKVASVGGGETKVTVKQTKQTKPNTERKKGEGFGNAGEGRTS